jgi:uncharacterized protein (DUF927 family)
MMLPSKTISDVDKMKLPGTDLTQHDINKLETSYITPDLAQQALLRRVDSAEGGMLMGRNGKGNYSGIIFPYLWPGNPAVREYRLRRDHPDLVLQQDGNHKEENKYLSPPQRSPMLYLVPGTQPAWLTDVTLPVTIPEGEKKTISLYRLAFHDTPADKPRFLPVGISGVWNWRGTVGKASGPSGGRLDVKGPIPDLDNIEWKGRDVYIIFDTNVQTNPNVKQARKALARELSGRGAKIYFVNLPQAPGVNGVDDLLAAQGPDVVLELIQKTTPATVPVPHGFRVSDSGVYSVDSTGEKDDIWICSRLDVAASSRDASSENWGQLLAFKDKDESEHTWLMPMSLLAGDGSEYRARLMSMGLQITPNRKAREYLTTYIQTANPDERVRCVDRIGWHGGAFVFPDETKGDTADERIMFQSPSGSKHKMAVSGTLQDWRDNVAHFCSGNSRLVFAVSCAFAGPLLSLVGESSGGFHLRGRSSSGKTTAQYVAGSVWGGGSERGYLQTWRSTANGLEAVAELHNHGLLCLDELSQCPPHEAGEIAYMLGNGEGKSRMTRSIGARKRLEWEMIFLSSGEISLADHVQAAGKRTRAGQEVRLCDLVADAGCGLGIFENLHTFDKPSSFADHLTQMSKQYYGAPIRAYTSLLVNHRSDIVQAARRIKKKFIDDNVPEGASGEVYRVASRFGVVAAAGESAEEITGWQPGEALAAAETMFNSWLAGRGTSGAGDIETSIRQVRVFIELHGASRFQEANPPADRQGDFFQEKIINRAGFKDKDADGELEYLIFPEVYKQEVCRGFDSTEVAKALVERSYMVTESGGKFSVRRHLPELGRKRVYVIRAAILEDV